MYLSHRHKLMFLRVPKTASSSMCEYLITNIDDDDALYMKVDDSNIFPSFNKELKSIVRKYYRNSRYMHLTLQEFFDEGFVTQEMLDTYRIVAVLREPVDRQMSMFYYFHKSRDEWKLCPKTLKTYKRMILKDHQFAYEPNTGLLQTDFLKVNGKSYGEYWLYEELGARLKHLLDDLGIEEKYALPRHKSQFRNKEIQEIEFDEETIAGLRESMAEDFRLYETLKK